MTPKETTKTSIFRRHPFLTAVSLLAAAGLTAASLFLMTFDLNAYRESLANRLSIALDQPVSIGSAHMSWRQGPAFNIRDIRIGEPLTESGGDIAHLFLHPRLLPLLMGKVVFDDMIIERPIYHARLLSSSSDTGTDLPTIPLRALLQTIQVHNLTIIDGQLRLENAQDDRHPLAPLQINAINLNVRNLLTGRPGKLNIHAELPQKEGLATLDVKGKTTFDTNLGNWRQIKGQLRLQMENIATEQLRSWLSLPEATPALSGRASLELNADGSAASGLHFSASLSGKNLQLAWPGRYAKPPAVKKVTVSGTWVAAQNINRVTDLDLYLDTLNIRGHFSLQRDKEQPWLEGTLACSPLQLSDIRRFLPDRIRLSEQALLHTNLDRGTVQIHDLRFAGPLSHFKQAGAPLPITHTRTTLSDARLQLPSFPALEQVNCTLTLTEGLLHLSQGKATLLQQPVRFNATTEHLLQDDMSMSFSADWDAPAQALWQGLPGTDKLSGKAGGVIPVSLSLNGAPGNFRTTMQASLAGCALEVPGILSKKAGSPGDLRVSGHQQKNRWILDQGQFNLVPFRLNFSGQLDMGHQNPLALQWELSPTDLQEAGKLIPALSTYHTTGTLGLTGQLTGPLATPEFSGQARLTDAGFALDSIEADVKAINGSISIKNQECHFTGVKARLGQSAVTLEGKLTGISDPIFRLRVRAPQIRAEELIFPGSHVVFHNMDGSMTFNHDAIRYQNIRFDLQDSRKLHLDGIQRHTHPTTVELDIHAEQASIDEVLALWEKDSASPPEATNEETDHNAVLKIRAAVDKGHYGPLIFSDATGLIAAQDNVVTIKPLNFRAASGSAQAEIIIDNNHEQLSMLNIAAELNDMDAAHLHNQWFRHPGLITGKLSGRLQLQGPAGPDLLSQGTGQANIRIKDGVLHKFSFLSKVFSLLNISQLFNLHLPDMASKGMPFNVLDGSLQLQDGILSSEDLTVASNAMDLSLVGSYDLPQDDLDLLMGVKPFGTVDKVVSKIPLAGWILTGDNKALITAHFQIRGPSAEPEVKAIPVTSVSKKVLGIFQRVLGLPGKVVSDVGKLFQGEEKAKDEADQSTTELENQSPGKERQPL
ncbi:hypothetical protein Pcar_2358 [Syntrophotalea carbinolica DSM 2380]|uniref:YhdP central domain-containing protein n=1 Tax=Syntrophotalea carbinolica (strain DSM 2380 / NBRC 103641 / GraBd1) TaxID=338963 RepID=Q3A210_SYNC1|nr:AsmA-like C-terminal domain-containing protein [Syntrophotalea carbinolica]ABA89597.1 hypothetical protein Pcar_2358 [Syntrophotalea carbinolica DSM 2380]